MEGRGKGNREGRQEKDIYNNNNIVYSILNIKYAEVTLTIFTHPVF